MCLCIQKHCIMLEYASYYAQNYAGIIRQGLVGRQGSGSCRQGWGSPRRGSGTARLGSRAARRGSGAARLGSGAARL